MQLEAAKWSDEGSTAKERRAAEREMKRKEKEEADRAKRDLYAAEQAEIAKVKLAPSAKKEVRENRKVTHYEVAQTKAEEERRRAERVVKEDARKEQLLPTVDFMEVQNLNHERRAQQLADEAKYGVDNVHIASGSIESAIKTLSIAAGGAKAAAATAVDRNPERRRKAAFKAYEEDRMVELRAWHPELKFSQLKEMIFKEWQTSPLNPVVQAQAAGK